MTYAPSKILDLRKYLKIQTGLSDIQLGIVGDTRHKSGYHLGKDRISSANDYSILTSRDRAGLSNAASALDIGNFNRLRALSIFMVERCRSGSADCRDIREVIYSPDGVKVLRWDRMRGISSRPREGEASDSHRTHTHISWFRDSESKDKIAPFRAFFEDKETEMQITKFKDQDWQVDGDNGVYRSSPVRGTPYVGRLPTNEFVRTRAEIRTIPGPDGDWRAAEWDVPGEPEVVYFLRSDLKALITDDDGDPVNP